MVIGQPDSAELPPRLGSKEVAIAGTYVRPGRGARAPAQHHLVAHEFAVVLAQCAFHGMVAGISQIGAARPLPYIPENLRQTFTCWLGRSGCRMKFPALQKISRDLLFARGDFPLRFRGK